MNMTITSSRGAIKKAIKLKSPSLLALAVSEALYVSDRCLVNSATKASYEAVTEWDLNILNEEGEKR